MSDPTQMALVTVAVYILVAGVLGGALLWAIWPIDRRKGRQ